MSSLPEDLESYGYKENAAKTFERLIQPKKKHIYSGTALNVDARHDEQKCYLIYSGKEVSVCLLFALSKQNFIALK